MRHSEPNLVRRFNTQWGEAPLNSVPIMSSAEYVGRARPATLWLPFEYQWELHHLLLDRIQRDAKSGTQTREGPLQAEVYEAFEALDGGDVRFTVDQVEAMQRVLRSARRSTTSGERRRDQIDQLLDRLSIHLTNHRKRAPADRQRTFDLPTGIDGAERSA